MSRRSASPSSAQATTDATLTELIETRVGEPLSVAEVRETIAHLYSLGRFQDVQVEAIDAADGAVALRYTLIPIHAVERVEFAGSLGLSEGPPADRLQERFGRTPQLGRAAEATRMLERLYQDHGYFNPSIRVESAEFHDPDRTVLTFRHRFRTPGPDSDHRDRRRSANDTQRPAVAGSASCLAGSTSACGWTTA